MYLSPTVLLTAALVVTASALSGLANAALHRADNASWPSAARAGAHAALTTATVLLGSIGVLMAR